MNRQQRRALERKKRKESNPVPSRALERKKRKESNPVPNEYLKKLEGILGKPITFRDDDGDFVFSWKRENNDQLEVYFRDGNHVGYHISTDSEMVGGGTTADKITILAEAFKAGTSGIDIIQLEQSAGKILEGL